MVVRLLGVTNVGGACDRNRGTGHAVFARPAPAQADGPRRAEQRTRRIAHSDTDCKASPYVRT
jgi:hypothetical protein